MSSQNGAGNEAQRQGETDTNTTKTNLSHSPADKPLNSAPEAAAAVQVSSSEGGVKPPMINLGALGEACSSSSAAPASPASKLLDNMKEALLPFQAGSEDFEVDDLKHATEDARLHWRRMSLVRNAARRFRYTPRASPKEMTLKSSSGRFRVGASAVRAFNRFKSVLPKLHEAGLEKAKAVGFGVSVKQLEELVSSGNPELLEKSPYFGVARLASALGTSPEAGIPGEEEDIERRRKVYGSNALPEKPAKPFLEFVWDAMQDSTLWILAACAIASLLVGIFTEGIAEGWYDGAGILLSILLVVAVTSVSDFRQSLQFRMLEKEKKKVKVGVVRGGRRDSVLSVELVVGDIVHVTTGDILPADGLLVEGHSLVVDESSMTGESMPVYKGAESPFFLAGTKVQDGHGTMLVLGVGLHTEWGQLMNKLTESVDDETPLQVKLSGVATFIGRVGLYVAVLVFILLLGRLVLSTPWNQWSLDHTLKVVDYFAVAVTIVVVAVPEGLPLAVTLALAFAMKKMMADKALVRKLAACETMGSATTICSDKTGTLTANQMTAVKLWLPHQSFDLEEASPMELELHETVRSTLTRHLLMNTSGDVEGSTFYGTPTETALLALGVGLGGNLQVLRKESGLQVLKFVPFSSSRKRVGAVVRSKDGRVHVFWKGAGEIMLQGCTRALNLQGEVEELDKSAALAVVEQFSSKALRTLTVAYRELEASEVPAPEGKSVWPEGVEVPDQGLVLQAIVGIKDPLRKEVKRAIEICRAAGIQVRMVTGDNVKTAVAIAEDAGILTPDGVAIEGPVFRALSKEKIRDLLPRLQVMARSSPSDKHLLVRSLREMGDVVAVTGDGTNDAPALKEAEIGLAMGIAGTEVAKESADVIIMDDNFSSVVNVARWGRSVYTNIQKFVQFQLTVNIVALSVNFWFALSSGSAPLTAVQLLWVNLIMDSLGALALATEPPDDALMQLPPVGKRVPFISPVMWRNILGQAAFQLLLLYVVHLSAVSLLGLQHTHPGRVQQALDTILFNTFVFCQLFNEVNSREMERVNVLDGLGRNYVFLLILASCTLFQTCMVQYLGKLASTVPLTTFQFLFCIALASLSLPVAALVKLLSVSVGGSRGLGHAAGSTGQAGQRQKEE